MSKAEETIPFEEALARLEAVVTAMESGKLSLEESMKHFEEGMRLTRICSGKLGEAEKRIEILLRKAEGAPEWQPFPAAAAAGPSPPETDAEDGPGLPRQSG